MVDPPFCNRLTKWMCAKTSSAEKINLKDNWYLFLICAPAVNMTKQCFFFFRTVMLHVSGSVCHLTKFLVRTFQSWVQTTKTRLRTGHWNYQAKGWLNIKNTKVYWYREVNIIQRGSPEWDFFQFSSYAKSNDDIFSSNLTVFILNRAELLFSVWRKFMTCRTELLALELLSNSSYPWIKRLPTFQVKILIHDRKLKYAL